MQALPSLREYCIIVAQSVTSVILEQEMSLEDPNVQRLIEDLQQEFIDSYAQLGMPYGEQEEDLVKYLLETVTISVEE